MRRPRLAAFDIGGELWEAVQLRRAAQAAQYRDQHQIADGERFPVDPLVVAERHLETLKTAMQILDDRGVTGLRPVAIGLENVVNRERHDERLHRIERGDEPLDRTDTRRRIGWDQLPAALGDTQNDRT